MQSVVWPRRSLELVFVSACRRALTAERRPFRALLRCLQHPPYRLGWQGARPTFCSQALKGVTKTAQQSSAQSISPSRACRQTRRGFSDPGRYLG